MYQTEINRYRAALSMDPDGADLGEVAARQARQHEEICRNYVYAKSRAAEAGTNLTDNLDAGYLEKRREDKKTTMTELKARVKLEQPYMVAARTKADADHEVEKWKGLRESSRQRKDMIEVMADLLINGHLKGLSSKVRESSDGTTYGERRAARTDRRTARAKQNENENGNGT